MTTIALALTFVCIAILLLAAMSFQQPPSKPIGYIAIGFVVLALLICLFAAFGTPNLVR